MLPTPSRSEILTRVPRLIVGLVLFGIGIALMVIANLGLSPWEVMHQGISRNTGIPIGTVGILTGIVVLVLVRCGRQGKQNARQAAQEEFGQETYHFVDREPVEMADLVLTIKSYLELKRPRFCNPAESFPEASADSFVIGCKA